MKLKDLLEQYGEYEVIDTTDLNVMNAGTLEKNEGIQIRLEKPKPKTVWDLKCGDSYFVVYYDGLTYTCGSCKWSDTNYEKAQRETGILFLTKEEVEKDIERRKVETLLLKCGGRRWFNANGNNWYLLFDMDLLDSVIIYNELENFYHGAIFFDTEEQAEKAISEIGEERIKKALFEVR